jgi:hypothetical protein
VSACRPFLHRLDGAIDLLSPDEIAVLPRKPFNLQTRAGRYLRVIYVADPVPDSVFVITAYELSGKPLAAYRRRRKKKQLR